MFGFGRIKELEEKYEKLNRIVKYSKDEPTFKLAERRIWPSDINVSHTIRVKHDLHMYIDKEEYIVHLIELNNLCIVPKHCDFRVEDNFVYFTAKRYLDGVADEFIIDYKSGAYVHKKRALDSFGAKITLKEEKKEESEVKECTDC